uniref:Uncharacterized protein n=1 Tax=Micrurus surinamensis TaxID=129470 RepID=A0A2D4PTH6_MICSU
MPTAARQQQQFLPDQILAAMKEWMEMAIQKGIAAGVQWGLAARQVPRTDWESRSSQGGDRPLADCAMGWQDPVQEGLEIEERGSIMGMSQMAPSLVGDTLPAEETEEEEEALARGGMSEDEELTPNLPTFTGLFKSEMFRSLLFKAKTTARLQKAKPDQVTDTEQESEDMGRRN